LWRGGRRQQQLSVIGQAVDRGEKERGEGKEGHASPGKGEEEVDVGQEGK